MPSSVETLVEINLTMTVTLLKLDANDAINLDTPQNLPRFYQEFSLQKTLRENFSLG